MSKVIWYLHHYAGSPTLGMSHRPYFLTKEFNKQGLHAYVIAANFHHLLQRTAKQAQAVSYELIEEVPYLWLKTPSYQGNGVGRMANILSYCAQLYRHHAELLTHTQIPDVIIVSSPHPYHYFCAKKIAKKYNAKLIFEVRDILTLGLREILGLSPHNPLVKLTAKVEETAFKQAHQVVSLLPNALDYMQQHGLTAERYAYIPNGITISQQNKTPDTFAKLQQLKAEGKFLLAYTGAFGIPNALDKLIEAMAVLAKRDKQHIHAVLLGKGVMQHRLKQQTKDLTNVSFFEPIAKDKVADFLSHVDVAYVGLRELAMFKHGVSPNKLFEYMLAAKPIIQAIQTTADLVQIANCGISVSLTDSEKLADAIEAMANMPVAQRTQLGENGRNYVVKWHNYEYLAEQYIKLF